MTNPIEITLGAIGKNADAVSAARNAAEASQSSTEAHKYINAVIDTAKVAYFWLDAVGIKYPLLGIGTNVANLGKALYDIDREQNLGNPITLGPVLTATTAVGDLLADFALTRGLTMLQPQVVTAGLLVKGLTTSLTYVGLVLGDTVLIPGRTAGDNPTGTGGQTSDGSGTLPAVIVTADSLDFRDTQGNLVVQLDRNNGSATGFTFYEKDPITGQPVTIDLTFTKDTFGRPVLEAEFSDQANTRIGSLTQSIDPNGDRRLVIEGIVGQPTVTSILRTFDDAGTLELITPTNGSPTLRATDINGQVRTTDLRPSLQEPTQQQIEQRQKLLQDDLFTGSASFLNALRAKDKVGMLLSGGKMALDYARYSGANTTSLDGFLGDVSATVGVLGALQGLRSRDTLTQLGSAGNLLRSANFIAGRLGAQTSGAVVNGYTEAGALGFLGAEALQLLNQFGAVLSIAGLANLPDMLDNGQYGSAIGTTVGAINGAAFLAGASTSAAGAGAFIPMDATTLVIFIVAIIVIDELMKEDPPPQPPTGEATFRTLANGSLTYDIANAANGGQEILTAKMGAIVDRLNAQIAYANGLDQQGKDTSHAQHPARQHPLLQVRGIGAIAGALPLWQIGLLTGRRAHQRAQVVRQHLGKQIHQCQGRILVCHLAGGTDGRAVCETSQTNDAGTQARGALDRGWFGSAQNTRREGLHRQHQGTPDDARSSRLRAGPEPRRVGLELRSSGAARNPLRAGE